MDFEETFKIAAIVNRVTEKAVGLIGKPERQGGYFALTLHEQDLCVPIGKIDRDKALKYYTLAREKIKRLELHREHLTSYQSRDPKAKVVLPNGEQMPFGKWGGGIRTQKGPLIAFSGLPELWDEAVMFVVAIKLGWSDKAKTLRRISRTRNPHLRPLLEACNNF